MNPALQAILTIVIGVGGCLFYFYGSNLFLDKVLFPAKGPNAGVNINRANAIRPWLFLFPAVVALGLYLAYPVFATFWLSFTTDGAGNTREFVGLANYSQMFGEPKFWESMRNNLLWLVVVPAAATAFGLLAAQLTDRISWGNIGKSLIFMPMAISFVGASVIWKLIYDTRPEDAAQIGALNAVWLKFEGGIWSTIFLKVVPALLGHDPGFCQGRDLGAVGAGAGSGADGLVGVVFGQRLVGCSGGDLALWYAADMADDAVL
jgi:alpha-glucoside transport system permease protein